MIRVLLATGQTGGGHLAQAEAIAAALAGHARVEVVDILPGSVLQVHRPATRTSLSRRLYGLVWRATNSPAGARLLHLLTSSRAALPPFDVAVSTHPMLVAPLVDAARRRGGRVIAWCPEMGRRNNHAVYAAHPRADYFLFGHERSVARFVDELGVAPSRARWSGFPLRAPFSAPRAPREEHRARLGLVPGRSTVLITAGGEGTGPVLAFVRALHARPGLRERAQVAVVCGRNEGLRRRLEAEPAKGWLTVHGGVDAERMRDLVGAAEVVCGLSCGVTQIMEAIIFGRAPFLAVDSLDGQERENEGLLAELGIGVGCRPVGDAAALAERLLGDPHRFAAGIEAMAQAHADAPGRVAAAVLAAKDGW
jgi:UDP-N-acetylglucosamine:LPS N-acetylglucosamine transferase